MKKYISHNGNFLYRGDNHFVYRNYTQPDILMPDGKYWKYKDLDIDDGQGGVFVVNDITVNGINFGTQYYYTHDAALRIAETINGYHLPTHQEWYNLCTAIGQSYETNVSYNVSKSMRTVNGWNSDQGTDVFGFGVLPVGNIKSNSIEWTGNRTNFWCYDKYSIRTRNYAIEFLQTGYSIRNEGGSFYYKVRLVKDSE